MALLDGGFMLLHRRLEAEGVEPCGVVSLNF